MYSLYLAHYESLKQLDPLERKEVSMPKKTCSVPTCDRPHCAKGLCRAHWRRSRIYGHPEGNTPSKEKSPPSPCSVEGCDRLSVAKGLCLAHWQRVRTHGHPQENIPLRERTPRGATGPCSIDGCDKPRSAHGYCALHYKHWSVYGDPLKGPFNHTRHTGMLRRGYVQVKVGDRYIAEQRLVMEGLLGRPLSPDETVFHKNGVRSDNRPENLELWTTRHPKGLRVQDIVEWSVETLERYAPDKLQERIDNANNNRDR